MSNFGNIIRALGVIATLTSTAHAQAPEYCVTKELVALHVLQTLDASCTETDNEKLSFKCLGAIDEVMRLIIIECPKTGEIYVKRIERLLEGEARLVEN